MTVFEPKYPFSGLYTTEAISLSHTICLNVLDLKNYLNVWTKNIFNPKLRFSYFLFLGNLAILYKYASYNAGTQGPSQEILKGLLNPALFKRVSQIVLMTNILMKIKLMSITDNKCKTLFHQYSYDF